MTEGDVLLDADALGILEETDLEFARKENTGYGWKKEKD